jgi:hypothetical protein
MIIHVQRHASCLMQLSPWTSITSNAAVSLNEYDEYGHLLGVPLPFYVNERFTLLGGSEPRWISNAIENLKRIFILGRIIASNIPIKTYLLKKIILDLDWASINSEPGELWSISFTCDSAWGIPVNGRIPESRLQHVWNLNYPMTGQIGNQGFGAWMVLDGKHHGQGTNSWYISVPLARNFLNVNCIFQWLNLCMIWQNADRNE